MQAADSTSKLQHQQWRVIACGLQTGVWLAAAVVLSRRVSGDATGFATQWVACLVGCGAMAINVLTTSFLKGDHPRALSAKEGLLPEALTLMPGLMLGLALLPADSGDGLAAMLGLFAVAFGVQFAFAASSQAWVRARPIESESRGEAIGSSLSSPSPPRGEGPSLTYDSPLIEPLPPKAESIGDTDSPLLNDEHFSPLQDELADSPRIGPGTQQWMSRSLQDGYDVIEGEVQIQFEASQRLVAVHLPFSPSLPATPEFECESVEDLDLNFRTTARHSYGVRFEASRSGSLDQPATATVGWAASAEVDSSTGTDEQPAANAA